MEVAAIEDDLTLIKLRAMQVLASRIPNDIATWCLWPQLDTIFILFLDGDLMVHQNMGPDL